MIKACGAVLFREQAAQIQFLLVESAAHHYWGLVKGHVETGEGEETTARREIAEEVGLAIANFVPGYRVEKTYQPAPGVDKLVVYLLASAPDTDITLSDEHTDYAWLAFPDAVDRLTFRNDRKALASAVTLLATP